MKLERIHVGKAVLDRTKDTTNVTIILNDSPYGGVEFVDTSILTDEEQGRNTHIQLRLVRKGGLYGDLKVTYR